MEEKSEKSQRTSREKKKRNISRRIKKPNAMLIWIAIEAVLVLAVVIAAIIKNVYGEVKQPAQDYTIPTEDTAEISIDEIELPTDLTADTAEDEEAVVGNIYDMDYSEDVLNAIGEMDTRQKIRSLLLTSPEALCNRSNVTIAGDVFRDAYTQDPVAGLFFTDSNFTSEAAGMKMLASIRGWSRDITGMNILIGYSGTVSEASAQSDRGINVFSIPVDAENISELTQSASDNNMIPAVFVSPEDMTAGEEGGLKIAATDDTGRIIAAINDGQKLMYMTGDFRNVCDVLSQAADNGDITQEALDSAVGNALTIRQTLTQMRPEDAERTPPEETASKSDSKKTDKKAKAEPKKMTPEEEAAAALAALQKQAEEAMKAATKQAEDAAKAAQGQ